MKYLPGKIVGGKIQHYIINPTVNLLDINQSRVYTYAEWSAVSSTPQIAPMRVEGWQVGDSLSTKSFDDAFQNGMSIILPVKEGDVVKVKIYGTPKIGSALRKIGCSVNGIISVGDTPYTLTDGEFSYTVPLGVDHIFITLGQAPLYDDWSCLDNCWVVVNKDLPPKYKNMVYGYCIQKGD